MNRSFEVVWGDSVEPRSGGLRLEGQSTNLESYSLHIIMTHDLPHGFTLLFSESEIAK